MVKVKLGLQVKSIPSKIVFGDSVVGSMTASTFFKTPQPPLADVLAASDALKVAASKASKGGKAATEAMYSAEAAFDSLMIPLGYYVEGVANALPDQAVEIINSANMEVKRKGSIDIPLLQVKQTDIPQTVIVRRKAVRGNSYLLQMSTNIASDANWQTVKVSTIASIMVDGLQSLTRYWFRVALIKGNQQQDFCDPVTIVIE